MTRTVPGLAATAFGLFFALGQDTATGQDARPAGAPAPVPVAVTGQLVDPDGQPVRDARVAVLSEKNTDLRCDRNLDPDPCLDLLVSRGALRAEGRTRADGSFSLPVSGGLTNFDHLRAMGRDAQGLSLNLNRPLRSFSVGVVTPSPELGQFKMDRARELVLFVHAAGQPVADAEVDFNRGEKRRTDRTGNVVYRIFTSTAADTMSGVSVLVRAPGYAVDAWFGGIPPGSTNQAIALVPEKLLSGRVLDAKGPVEGAVVALRPNDLWLGPYASTGGGGLPDDTITRTRTDASGQFVLSAASPARTYRVVVEPPASRAAAAAERIVPGGSPPLDIVLSATGRLDVDITGPAQATLTGSANSGGDLQRLATALPSPTQQMLRRPPSFSGGLSLEWFDTADGSWKTLTPPRQILVDERDHARVRFEQVPVGTVRVVTGFDTYLAADVSDPVVIVGDTTGVAELHLVAPMQLQVRVVDEQNQPVKGARVEVSEDRVRRYVQTGADGLATMAVHPLHDVILTVSSNGRLQVTTIIPAGVQSPPPVVLRPAR